MIFFIYLALGAVAGVLAGLFGVGGGLIIVPALIYSFTLQGFSQDALTHMAVGTSLGSIVVTSISSTLAHNAKESIRWPLVRQLSLGVVVGVALGSFLASGLSGSLLQKIFGVFAIAVAVQLALNLQPKASVGIPGRAGLGAAGGVIGGASAVFGVGGGSLTVPFLCWSSLPMQQAVAASAACGIPIAVMGALSYMWLGWSDPHLPRWSLGYVYLPAVLGIGLTSLFFSRVGARLAYRLSPLLLKRLFALLLVMVGISFWV